MNGQPTWLRCGKPDAGALTRCAAMTKAGDCCRQPAALLAKGTDDERPDRWCKMHRAQYNKELP